MTATATPPKGDVLDVDAGVIEDARARQLRHRRRAVIGLLVIAALGGVAAIAALAISGSRSPAAPGDVAASGLPTGALATLHAAGPIAVAPNGALYVADAVGVGVEPGGDRVLVRLPDGRFRVVAGSGRVGFTGDGGRAVRAELSRVSDLALAPDGTLYIADGGRVRTVTSNGVIRTVAGDGQPARTVANGTPALSAPLGARHSGPALSIALSPDGQLYISTGAQILRLTAAGTLDPIRAIVASAQGNLADRAARGKALSSFDHIAVDTHGNIDVAGGPGGWAVWQVTPDGTAHLASGDQSAHGNGGADPILERGPAGAIYAAAGAPGIVRVERHKLVPIAAINRPLSRPPARPEFLPLNFAFSSNGTLYADDEPFSLLYTDTTSAFKARQQLLSISTGHVSLLWQEKNATSK